MVKCVFCGKDSNPHKGTQLIRNSGTVDYFCSNKCLKNSTKLKRDKRKIRWTEAFHVTREKARARAIANKEKEAEKAKAKSVVSKKAKK